MTPQEIDKLSLEDCRDKLKSIYSDEYKANMYISLTEKMQLITDSLNSIEEINLRDKEDKQLLDLIRDFAKNGSEMSKSLDEIRETLDKDILKKAKETRKKAKPLSVESLVLNS